jgi:hypothetical protein
MNVNNAITEYAEALRAAHGDDNIVVEAEAGRKFVKIIVSRKEHHGAHRHVHAFVNKSTGSLYKPAGWKGPVQDERYNLLTEMDMVKKVIDPYGSYLYADAVSRNRRT